MAQTTTGSMLTSALRQPVRFALALTLLGSASFAQDLALKAARVHTGAGAPIENGIVLVRGGKIEAVGADVQIPAGMRTVEHPADLSAGMIALRDYAGTQGEHSDSTRAMLPGAELRHAHSPGHGELKALLESGITAYQLGASESAVVGGMTAVVKTAGERVVHPRCHLAVTLSSDALRPDRYPTSYAALMDEMSAQVEAGQGVFAAVQAKKMPLWIYVETRHEVAGALGFLQRHELPGALHGAARIGEMAEQLAAAGIGVGLPAFQLGGTHHSARSAVALAKAGVPFGYALDSPGNDPSALRLAAAAALRAGLPAGKAWASLTTDAARLCRSDKKIGSVAAGKDADLVLWSGHPLDLGSQVVEVFVDGKSAHRMDEEKHDAWLEEIESKDASNN